MLCASLVIASGGLSTVLIINTSAKQSYGGSNTLLIPNVQYQIVAKTPQSVLTKDDYAVLRNKGFSQLIAIATASSHIYKGEERLSKRRITLTGIDSISLLPLLTGSTKSAQNTTLIAQNQTLGSMAFGSSLAIGHPNLLAELEADNNSTQRLSTRPMSELNALKLQNYALPKLIGMNNPSLGNDLICDIGEFYRLFPDAELSSLLLVGTASSDDVSYRISQIEKQLPTHLKIVAINTNIQQGELTNSFHINLLAMALLMFVVCLFIVINAVNLLINARMPWFKICRQLGISRYQIFANQLIEMSLITLFTSCVGIYLSIHLSNIVSPSIQATLEGLYGVQVGFGNISLLGLFMQVFGISLLGCIAATITPFLISNKSLNSIKSKINVAHSQSRWRRVFWLSSVIFAAIAFSLLQLDAALWLMLLATALLILSGCSLLLANYPQVICVLDRLIPPSFTLLKLSTQQSVALSGKTKVACCAFFIAVTSNIGMKLMVDSFRNATLSWLDSRLTSDYYLYYDGNEDIAALAKTADVELYQRYEKIINYKNNKNIQLHSYPTTVQFKQAMVFYERASHEQAWDDFENEKAVFVNQQFAFSYGYKVGTTITLPHPTTNVSTTYVIQGIIYDFGNAYKQVIMPLSAFDGSLTKSSIYSIIEDEAGLARFKQALDSANINYQNSLLSTKELLAISEKTFNRTFLITDGLNVVTLLVAALSLACAIVVLMNDTRPQNMLIRSLGISAIKTQLLALFQYLLLCLVALIFATPFGILLSWVLIYDINFHAFKWTYPLQIDVLKIAYIYIVSLSVVLLVISIPIVRAGKRPLIKDIRRLN